MKHSLSNVDRAQMTADCTVCGRGARLLLHGTKNEVYCARGRQQGKPKSEWHTLADKDTEKRTATCSKCGPVEMRRQGASGWQCVNLARERHRRNHLKRTYGLTHEEVEAMQGAGGRCAVCKTNKATAVDHDHETGRVRGILCSPCNMALGLVKDSPTIMRNMIRYIEKGRHEH